MKKRLEPVFARVSLPQSEVEACGATVCDGLGPVDCLWNAWSDWCRPCSAQTSLHTPAVVVLGKSATRKLQ